MRDEDWKTIITLHECQNLTKAARAMYVSQPTLTKQLHRIENELGVSVVKRSNKGVSFTPEGEYLAHQAGKIMEVVQETKKNIWKMRDGLGGTLKIGTSSSFARSQLPKLLSAYSAKNDQVRFKVTVMLSTEVLEAVRSEGVHVGFVNGDRDHNEKQVLCSCGAAYAIANRPIEKWELPTMDMVMHNRDAYSKELLESWWKNNFDEPMRIGTIVQDIDTSLKWVRDGLGYGVVFSNCLSEDDHFYKLPLLDHDGKPMRRNTWAICKKDYADFPIIENFMNFIEENGPMEAD
jgi:DNA-binding transcriptional LysR family regulator